MQTLLSLLCGVNFITEGAYSYLELSEDKIMS